MDALRLAKDGQLADSAAEIKARATRRIGEIMEEMRQAKEMAKGTRGQSMPPAPVGEIKKKPAVYPTLPASSEKMLSALGIDKDLAKRVLEAAAMFDEQCDSTEANGVSVQWLRLRASRGTRRQSRNCVVFFVVRFKNRARNRERIQCHASIV